VVLKVFGNGTVTHPADLASRDLVDVEFALSIDLATPVGTELYLVATIDPLDAVEEAIETNNVLELSRVVGPERRASLNPVEPFAPDVFRDETNAVMLDVRNDGDKTAPAGFELTLEVYEDASHLTEFCSTVVVACPEDIPPGQALPVELPLPLDISVPVNTWLYLVATIDSLDGVEEFDETDNVVEASVQVQVERMPDLIVDEILFPDYLRRGQSSPLTVRVRNDDNETATAPFTVTITEPSASWSDTWTVDTDLAPGAEISFTTSYTVASDASLGDRTFTATVDTTAAVVERDEGNNSLSETSLVGEFDLRLTLVDAPYGGMIVGVPYDFKLRVTNNGTMPNPATLINIWQRYAESNGYIVTLGEVLHTWPAVSVPTLQPGNSMDFTVSLALSGASSPVILIQFWVDPFDVIEEADEGNNDAFLFLE